MEYQDFLQKKLRVFHGDGFTVSEDSICKKLFPFQSAIVRWALRKGRAAIFADCGLGKTAMQLEWAKHVVTETGGKVIILAPLAVAQQTVREGEKFGISLSYVRDPSESNDNIIITNYEMLDRFDADEYIGVVLDESSILKSYDGKTRTEIIETFQNTKFRLACTATPAPNDHMELGNHSEFLGAMTRAEMLSMYFVHDGGETQKWRLKGHAESAFWKWVCSWAVMIRKPSDIGFSDEGFDLPSIEFIHSTVPGDPEIAQKSGLLFDCQSHDLQMRRSVRKGSINSRVARCAEIANEHKESPVLVWCDLNNESELASREIEGAVEVTGSQKQQIKEAKMGAFSDGSARVLVSKPSICGFGMNWQHCATVIFLGLSDSYESFYQAVRRCWRFGQTKPVRVYVVTSESEGSVVQNIQRKERDAAIMAEGMVEHMKEEMNKEIHGTTRSTSEYRETSVTSDKWEMRLGDCVEHSRRLASDSIHYTIFSPPFASLYTYSDSDRDMGNCSNHGEFFEHFRFLIKELFRATMPGRLLSFHCMNLPTSKSRDGVIGIVDFRGELIREFVSAGWIYHSEVVIWKDPVTAMQRTKALGLLHKQIKKDSCMSRQGIPDYLVTMRKPGDNPERVTHTNESFPVSLWQNYASPVWMDINPSNTLQKASAREESDERHICPLQLEVIDRALKLWTNPNDLVLSPFAGIGSEGHQSIMNGRRFLGFELKQSYFEQACANLKNAENKMNQGTLFSLVSSEAQ